MDDLLTDAVRQLLADQCTPQRVREIEAGDTPAALWQHIEDAGFADALVPEAAGGAGLGLAELYPVLELCGSQALPVPLGETLVARALLAEAGVARPAGSIALAQATPGDAAVRCARVNHGAVSDWVLAQGGAECRLLRAADAVRERAPFVLDATLNWPQATWDAAPRLALPEGELLTLQACVLAAQLAGALLTVFNRTLQYANDRVQFGKPIGKFQAIQHQLSVMAEHAFAARMAARIGCQGRGMQVERLRVAVAKARTGEAAVEVTALAHAIHGAIGFTEEFDLQLFTRRLHAWRQAAGAESYWHEVVGTQLLDRHDGLVLDLIRGASDIL